MRLTRRGEIVAGFVAALVGLTVLYVALVAIAHGLSLIFLCAVALAVGALNVTRRR